MTWIFFYCLFFIVSEYMFPSIMCKHELGLLPSVLPLCLLVSVSFFNISIHANCIYRTVQWLFLYLKIYFIKKQWLRQKWAFV